MPAMGKVRSEQQEAKTQDSECSSPRQLVSPPTGVHSGQEGQAGAARGPLAVGKGGRGSLRGRRGSHPWGWSLSQAQISPEGWQPERLGPEPLWLLWAETQSGRDLAGGFGPVVPKGVAQGEGIPSPP